jgi:phage terminase large subunit-like protein
MPRKEEEISLSDLLKLASTDLNERSIKPNRLMYKPHDKQQFLHRCTAKEKLFIGGNRSGKTVWNVMECVWWLTKTHPFRPDVNAIVEPIRGRLVSVSYNEGMEKIIIPYFKQFLAATDLINGSWDQSFSRYHRTLTLANGSFIEFMSYDQELEKFAGTSRHFCSFDEEPPQAIFTECLMRLMDTDGSYWISMTPVEGMTWIYYEIYEPGLKGDNPDLQILEINTEENPNIKKEALDRVTRGLSEDEKKVRKSGGFNVGSQQVFPMFNRNIHVLDEDFIPNRTMTIYTSYDHGWRHPAAWLWHAVMPDGKIVTFHELVKERHTVKQLSDLVKEYEKEFLEPLGLSVFLRAADPATRQTSAINGMSIAQTYAIEGLHFATENIAKGPGSVDVGLDKMWQYLTVEDNEPTWKITANCTTLVKQMGTMHYDKWASKKLAYENAEKLTISKKDDDAPDSARYFFTLMPDLYYMEEGVKKRIVTSVGNMSAVPYGSEWNNVAGFHDQMLPDTRNGEYTVYEGSELYALENY